jgi:hypothetical protein
MIANLQVNTAITITNPDDEEVARWRQVVDFAKRNQVVSPGWRLVKSRPYDRRLLLGSKAHLRTGR